MAAIADSIHAADEVQIEWRQDPHDRRLSCPRCYRDEDADRAMKEEHGGGLVCSFRPCRFRLSAEERNRAIPSTFVKGYMPCPKCLKPVKKHHTGFICSDRTCRHVFELKDLFKGGTSNDDQNCT